MAKTELSRERPRRRSASSHPKHGVTPVFPLILLETMREMDRPPEVLEGEDLSISMPRRFGLNDVVNTQIHRFRTEVRTDRFQDEAVVEDLIRLVIRRPDADEIFELAGRRVARQAWEERTVTARRAVGLMPRSLGLLAARRAIRRLFRDLVGSGRVGVNRRSFAVHIDGSLTARADPGGAACAFYAGAFAELLERYTGRAYRPLHPHCEGQGAKACEWTVLVKG